MTDPPLQREFTVFRIPSLLTEDVVSELRSIQGSTAFERAATFLGGPVCKWDKSIKAKSWREAESKGLWTRPFSLMKCRAEYDRFRSAIIAHADRRDHLGGLHLDRCRVMIVLCVSAAIAGLQVFKGQTWDAKADFYRYAHSQAELYRSGSVEYLHYSAGQLERKSWESIGRSVR
ncbi:MAG: hypothetical protein AB7E70_15850 [Hyphomicrobiaceae bacterium]